MMNKEIVIIPEEHQEIVRHYESLKYKRVGFAHGPDLVQVIAKELEKKPRSSMLIRAFLKLLRNKDKFFVVYEKESSEAKVYIDMRTEPSWRAAVKLSVLIDKCDVADMKSFLEELQKCIRPDRQKSEKMIHVTADNPWLRAALMWLEEQQYVYEEDLEVFERVLERYIESVKVESYTTSCFVKFSVKKDFSFDILSELRRYVHIPVKVSMPTEKIRKLVDLIVRAAFFLHEESTSDSITKMLHAEIGRLRLVLEPKTTISIVVDRATGIYTLLTVSEKYLRALERYLSETDPISPRDVERLERLLVYLFLSLLYTAISDNEVEFAKLMAKKFRRIVDVKFNYLKEILDEFELPVQRWEDEEKNKKLSYMTILKYAQFATALYLVVPEDERKLVVEELRRWLEGYMAELPRSDLEYKDFRHELKRLPEEIRKVVLDMILNSEDERAGREIADELTRIYEKTARAYAVYKAIKSAKKRGLPLHCKYYPVSVICRVGRTSREKFYESLDVLKELGFEFNTQEKYWSYDL